MSGPIIPYIFATTQATTEPALKLDANFNVLAAFFGPPLKLGDLTLFTNPLAATFAALPSVAPNVLGGVDGSAAAPTTSLNPSLSFERFDASNATFGHAAYYFQSLRRGGTTPQSYNILAYSDTTQTTGIGTGIAALTGIAAQLAGTTAEVWALVGAAYLAVVGQGGAIGLELDIVNNTGAVVAGINSPGSTYGVLIVSDLGVAGSLNNGVALQIVASPTDGTAAWLDGIQFGIGSVKNYGIDMQFATPTVAINLPNNISLSSRNAAASADVELLKADASNRAVLGGGTTDIVWGKALVALGGGAAPAVGTIGGSGPAVAAQNTWMRVVDTGGNAFFVPVWK